MSPRTGRPNSFSPPSSSRFPFSLDSSLPQPNLRFFESQQICWPQQREPNEATPKSNETRLVDLATGSNGSLAAAAAARRHRRAASSSQQPAACKNVRGNFESGPKAGHSTSAGRRCLLSPITHIAPLLQRKTLAAVSFASWPADDERTYKSPGCCKIFPPRSIESNSFIQLTRFARSLEFALKHAIIGWLVIVAEQLASAKVQLHPVTPNSIFAFLQLYSNAFDGP